ncbi:unnamed protein product [Heterobilharzia americana]|nr:unnamed protein product [Heterobilharzia americana]
MIFSIATLFGNSLVVLSVIRERSLRNATNWFIVSLAIADISLAILVMPLATWLEVVNGYWVFGTIVCDIFIMFDVLFCTASILNLVAICLDRYLAVTKPIVYAKHNNMRRVQISIGLVWIVSFLIAVPLVCGLNINRYNDPTICQSFNALYIIYSSLGSFYLPAIILIVVYQRIFALIKQRHKSLRLTQSSKPNHFHDQQQQSRRQQQEEQHLPNRQQQVNESSTIQLCNITFSDNNQSIPMYNNNTTETAISNPYHDNYPSEYKFSSLYTKSINTLNRKEDIEFPNELNAITGSLSQSLHDEFCQESNENLSDMHFEGPRLDIPPPNLYNSHQLTLRMNQPNSIDYLKSTNQITMEFKVDRNLTNQLEASFIHEKGLMDFELCESPKHIVVSSSQASPSSPYANEEQEDIYNGLPAKNTPSEHPIDSNNIEEKQQIQNTPEMVREDDSGTSAKQFNPVSSLHMVNTCWMNNCNRQCDINSRKLSCQHRIPFKSNIINLFLLPRINTCLNCTDVYTSSVSSECEYSWPHVSECAGASSEEITTDSNLIHLKGESTKYYLYDTTADSEDGNDDDVDEEEEFEENAIEELTDENSCKFCQHEIKSNCVCEYNFHDVYNCSECQQSVIFQYTCQPCKTKCHRFINHTEKISRFVPNGHISSRVKIIDKNNHTNIMNDQCYNMKTDKIQSNLFDKKKYNFHAICCKYLQQFNDQFKQTNQITAQNSNRSNKLYSKLFKSYQLNTDQHNNNTDEGNIYKTTSNKNKDVHLTNQSVISPVDLDTSSGRSVHKSLYNSPKHISVRNKNVLSQKEKKATKTLAIVLGVFLACWLPFFSINMSLGLCIYLGPDKYGFCEIAGNLMSSCTWLGYINSALNPVIYTIFNLEFRTAFKKLLHIR